jgi:hypothetical protein
MAIPHGTVIGIPGRESGLFLESQYGRKDEPIVSVAQWIVMFVRRSSLVTHHLSALHEAGLPA